MEAKRLVDLPADDLFQTIAELWLMDYNRQTKAALTVDDLAPGLSYQMVFGQKGEHQAQVKLLAIEVGRKLETKVTSNRGVTHMRYNLSEEAGQTLIHYLEENQTKGFFSKINQLFMGFVLKKSLEQRLEAVISQLIQITEEKANKQKESDIDVI